MGAVFGRARTHHGSSVCMHIKELSSFLEDPYVLPLVPLERSRGGQRQIFGQYNFGLAHQSATTTIRRP